MKNFIVIIFGTLLLFSCKKETQQFDDSVSRNYFPLNIGKQVVYDVDSIIWDDFTCIIDTNHYQMRWTVSDTFRGNDERLSYTIDVEIRESDSLQWQMHRVYAATPTATTIEFSENNLRFIKLNFPIENEKKRAGNNLISTTHNYQYLQGWEYSYTDVNKSFDNGLQLFDNTVTVEQRDETLNNPNVDPYATKTFAKEVYAKDVGMVYREVIYWLYDENVSRCKGGFGVVMRAREHN